MSKDQIAKAEEQVPAGAAYVIEVEDDNGKTRKCYLKKINRATMEAVLGLTMAVNSSPQYIRAGEIILTNCWAGGDEEIRKNDDLLVPAAMQAYRLVEVKNAELKKL